MKLNKQSSGVGKYLKWLKQKVTGGSKEDICPYCKGTGGDSKPIYYGGYSVCYPCLGSGKRSSIWHMLPDIKTMIFISGKLTAITTLIDSIRGRYISHPAHPDFDKNLGTALYAINRADADLKKLIHLF
jgi:hypothetical protein